MRALARQWNRRWLAMLAVAALYAAPIWLVRSTGEVFFKIEIDGAPVASANVEFGSGVSHPPGGETAYADATFTKVLDKASPKIAHLVCSDSTSPSVRMEVVQTGSNTVRFYSIRFTDAIFTGLDVGAASLTNDATERVSFSYGGIEWTYIQTDASDHAVSSLSTRWDVSSATGGVSDADSDGDGIGDTYEAEQGLKPLIDDGGGDLDLDGLINLYEYLAGTLANDSNSVFRVSGATSVTGDVVRVTFDSVAGRTYDVEVSDVIEGPPVLTRSATATGPSTVVELPALGVGPSYVVVKVRVE